MTREQLAVGDNKQAKMLSKIKAFFTGDDKDRTQRAAILHHKELATRLAEALSNAYKNKTTVKMIIEADGYEGGVLLYGCENLVEYLYNFAAAQIHFRNAELSEFDAKLNKGESGPISSTVLPPFTEPGRK